jgi:hypothetical protein
MRALTFGLILAFLFTSTHVLVDHAPGRHTSFALLPHLGPSHTRTDTAHTGAHHDHDHDGEPQDEHDPSHHQADTHRHFTWYTQAHGKIVQQGAPSDLTFDMVVVCPSVAVISALSRYRHAHAPLARGLPLSLRWSVLRI